MCMLTKTNRTKLLKKDIRAYKIVYPRDTLTVVSLHQKQIYNIDEVYVKEFTKPRYSKILAKYVWGGEGFHSYTALTVADFQMACLREAGFRSPYVIVECRIPAGSRVAVNRITGEMVSERIIIVEEM